MSDLTATLASSLLESAAAVAGLAETVTDIAILDESSVVAGMGLVRDHRRVLQAYELALAVRAARLSDHTLGYDGLARRDGSATPAVFIQSVTGSSIEEATKLARLGQSRIDAEATSDGSAPTSVSPVVEAAFSGEISVAAADAIRRGLGSPDVAVTAEQLAAAADELIVRAGVMMPEALLKAARRARNGLDLDAVERGQKQRTMIRYVRTWKRDGLSGGSWALPDEDGGMEIHTALKLLLAKTTGGPRFADTTNDSNPAHDRPPATVLEDERSPEQVIADGFAQIFHNGLTVNPGLVSGAGRAPVRVIVPNTVTTDRVQNSSEVPPTESAILEETHTAITFAKLEEYLCDGGTVAVALDKNGQLIDVGREQRLFTKAQRTGLGVRDGGCRFPGCDKPPSWTEAHHIHYWARDKGATDVANGILLCRYHHMLIHNTGWEIIRNNDGRYWLKPPTERDPSQQHAEMPTKNPLVAAIKHTQAS